MIDLKNHIASQLKIRLYFDGNWILISEITFDSFIVPISNNNYNNKNQLFNNRNISFFDLYYCMFINNGNYINVRSNYYTYSTNIK